MGYKGVYITQTCLCDVHQWPYPYLNQLTGFSSFSDVTLTKAQSLDSLNKGLKKKKKKKNNNNNNIEYDSSICFQTAAFVSKIQISKIICNKIK